MPTREEYRGHKAIVELYELDDGSCPASEYLDGLSATDRQKVDVLFSLFGDMGEIKNKEKFKKLEKSDGIFEFKSFQIRLLCFFGKGQPRRVIITHGVTKKSDKHAKSDITHAESIKKSFSGESK